MANNGSSSPTPPYVPWKTLMSFLKRLQDSTIPPVIDNSVMTGMSGGTQSQIKGAFRFLGLIDSDGNVTQALKDLVTAVDGRIWQETVREVVVPPYQPIADGVDLDKGTLAQLQQRFKDLYGATGSVLNKAIRFYLTALSEAGIKSSPYFKARGAGRPARTGDSTPRKRRKRQPQQASDDGGGPVVPAGTRKLQFPVPGQGDVVLYVPPGMHPEHWKLIDQYVVSLLKLEQQQGEDDE